MLRRLSSPDQDCSMSSVIATTLCLLGSFGLRGVRMWVRVRVKVNVRVGVKVRVRVRVSVRMSSVIAKTLVFWVIWS